MFSIGRGHDRPLFHQYMTRPDPARDGIGLGRRKSGRRSKRAELQISKLDACAAATRNSRSVSIFLKAIRSQFIP